MNMMEKLRDGAGSALDERERAQLFAAFDWPQGAVETLNAIVLDGSHIEGALRAVAALGARRDDGFAQGLAIQAYVETTQEHPAEIVAAALHARIVALDTWTAHRDPGRAADATSVMEAAARCPMTETAGSIAFEPARFADLVDFIGELPF